MNIAFFDFDGTITRKATFLQFIRFLDGRFEFYKGFLIFYLSVIEVISKTNY